MKIVLTKILLTICPVSQTDEIFGATVAVCTILVVVLLVWYFAIAWRKMIRQRAEWKASPIPPEISRFDAFFWKQRTLQQEWYLENIYTQDDIKSLITQYTDKIQSVWGDDGIPLQKRMDTVKMYMARINLLTYHLGYVEPQRSLLG